MNPLLALYLLGLYTAALVIVVPNALVERQQRVSWPLVAVFTAFWPLTVLAILADRRARP